MSDDDLLDEPAWKIRDLVSDRQVSAEEIVIATLRRIEERDRLLHAFLTVSSERAIDDAREIDRRLAAGEVAGPLCGVPVSIKDLYTTEGIRTTFGSLLFQDYIPDEDSVHAERLRAAGAVIIGKTNTPEFGIFIRTVNRLGPETVNPWRTSCTPGGSSGGAAASVAAGLTPIAVGSDGGGSIRIPAALCGVIGLFPSRGLIPRHGGKIGTRLFSSAGPLARSARDAAITLSVLSGGDPRDPMSWPDAPEDVLEDLGSLVGGGLRLKLLEPADTDGMTPAVLEAVRRGAERFASLGVDIVAAGETLDIEPWREPFYDIMMADRYASGGQEIHRDPATTQLLTDYTRAHLDKAALVTGAQYSRALDARLAARAMLYSLLRDTDALITPTVGLTAPEIDPSAPALPDVARRNFVSFTFLQNYTGLPAVSVPCGQVDGLPVGLQIIARPRQEKLILRLCHAFESLQTVPRPPSFTSPLRSA